MKKILFTILSFFTLSFVIQAQIITPIKWDIAAERISKTEAIVSLQATIKDGWHMYSQSVPEGGVIPTTVSIDSLTKLGIAEEVGTLEKIFDPNFGMDLTYYSHKVIFKQKVQVLETTEAINGSVEFMVCDSMMCLPPEVQEFNTIIPAYAKNNGLWGIYIAGFLGGLLALLTPCVFPMIPLTVSYFTKQANKGKGIGLALVYGVSIIIIYVILGFAVTKLLGADALNAMASNVYFNMAFFVMIVIFAVSFLGAFEITLPNSWINKSDSISEKGGILGVFFMAFTLALVSFSCTGPIIGTLLVETATSGNASGPLTGMLGFSSALALPFTLFAIFPSWLTALPQSGGWLNSVKVSLGLLELALAMKFLSNVDLAYHWGILDRDIFLVIWITIFTVLTIYLLGFLKFSHDSDLKYVSLPRLFFAMASLAFTLYLIPGIFGAPLKALSGVLPPLHTQSFILNQNNSVVATEKSEASKYTNILHCPNNLNCFFDYEEGMAYAKKVNKPVLLDFTGHSCANCREMEAKVWTDTKIDAVLRNDYVLISLYVDDKTELEESEKYTSKTGKKIETVGQKWSDFQATQYNTNSQPYYVPLNHKGEQLVAPKGYDEDKDAYLKFLAEGLEKFNK